MVSIKLPTIKFEAGTPAEMCDKIRLTLKQDSTHFMPVSKKITLPAIKWVLPFLLISVSRVYLWSNHLACHKMGVAFSSPLPLRSTSHQITLPAIKWVLPFPLICRPFLISLMVSVDVKHHVYFSSRL